MTEAEIANLELARGNNKAFGRMAESLWAIAAQLERVEERLGTISRTLEGMEEQIGAIRMEKYR